MAPPLLGITAFTTQYGTLSDAEVPVATRLLEVIADWIAVNAPNASAMATQQVMFEVVRDSLNLSEFAPLKQFENSTSRRTQSGTFNDADALIRDVLTDRQKRLLGIPLRAAAGGHFPVGDYGPCYGSVGRRHSYPCSYGQVDYY